MQPTARSAHPVSGFSAASISLRLNGRNCRYWRLYIKNVAGKSCPRDFIAISAALLLHPISDTPKLNAMMKRKLIACLIITALAGAWNAGYSR